MNCARSITLIMDGNFRRVGEDILSPHMSYARFGARFTDSFDQVVIVARSFPAMEAIGERVTGEHVSFVDLGANRGVRALITSVPRLLIRLYRQLVTAPVVLIRFPGNIASLALFICLIGGKRFSAEVVADPADYFGASASRHPLRRVARLVHCWTTRIAALRAVTVRYVTSEYLQRKYPATNADMMFGFSDVYLKDALFETPLVRTPRPDGGLRLINTAMMHNHSKGHGVLLQAVADLHKRDIAVELTLIGDGALRPEFETQAAQLGLGDHVTFVGIVNADLVADHVAEHDLFVLPSFQEGMPRAMLEAMAAGTPVIASNVGGIPEVLGEESMVAPGDVAALVSSIEMLARDRSLLQARAKAAREAALPFGFDALQARYRTYCDALLKAHGNA
ncbi:glycosyltransferase family 4 protein [uncultured Caballeronia sp.]|uniref:glycosyltransferase family 4 protein n=1 Tax=uncultured Caballeronia sp. TaxID=1827198 RepID=UPI0035C96D5F